jgi:patatin-like phospholipase/acyl hydrolase
MSTAPKRFRILSLDGGGIKGAFSAAVLTEWEKHSGKVIADHFDLIAGTSTGCTSPEKLDTENAWVC